MRNDDTTNSSESSRTPRPSTSVVSAQPRQLLGRRRRSGSDDQQQLRPEPNRRYRSSIEPNSQSHKRIRTDGAASMSSNGDGEASSNGVSTRPTRDSRTTQRGVSTNGTHKGPVTSLNGSHLHNGKQPSGDSEPTTTYFGHDREEVTRMLIQALSDMGYHSAAQTVSRDSGFELESPTVAAFRSAVLDGSWTEAEQFLFGAASAGDGPARTGNGLVLVAGADRDAMRFCIRKQKFLELLEQRDHRQALSILRTELTPLNQDAQQLHALSSLLMCPSAEDVKAKAGWDGASGQSRHQLLSSLSKCISPSVMLPEHRLAVLLQQVKDRQIDSCKWHTDPRSPSLYSDHTCDRSLFPDQVLVELAQPGEVWQISFSHDGKRLASCGADESIYIWDTTTLELSRKLDGRHKQGVGNIAWSPDDSMLVSCGRDNCARLWDLNTGDSIQRIDVFREPVSSCAWAPDGLSFVLGSFDKSNALVERSIKGEELYLWSTKARVEDLAISPDGKWLIAMDDTNQIHVYDFATRDVLYVMSMDCRITSISITKDSKYLLINKVDAVAELISISAKKPVQKYKGHAGGEFTIRSGLGGANESFVICGSEDGFVSIYHMMSGHAVERLDAHRPRCNAVAWSPTDPRLWASAGDDAKVKLWSSKDRARTETAHRGSRSWSDD